MVVVKNLALGVLLTGLMASPGLGGAIGHGHHPAHHARGESPPTATVGDAAAPVVRAAENLANLGVGSGNASFGIGNSGYGPAFGYGSSEPNPSTALGSTSSIWGTTTSGSQTTPTGNLATSGPAAVAAPAAPSYSAPAAAPSYSAPQGAGGHTVDAYLNFGSSPYAEASALTSGSPQAWYLSPAVQHVFGGTPDAAQQAGFIAEVSQTIQHAYTTAGLNVSLTTDPTQNYAHAMSIVSGASYNANSQAIGITDVGNDGFSFIDKLGQAQTPDQLATAVGNNLAHELMHAFGIAIHPDQTGTHIDAATASWGLLTDPNASFSAQAAQLLSAQNFLIGPGNTFTQGSLGLTGLEVLAGHAVFTGEGAVPEPTTIALWGLAGGIALAGHRRKKSA